MSGRFEPKTPVKLNPPKSDLISLDYLEKCNGTNVSSGSIEIELLVLVS